MKIETKVIGMRQVNRKLSRVASKNFKQAQMRAVEVTARTCERRLKTRFSGNPFRVRSGMTRASIRTQLYPARIEAAVGSSKRHVATLEEGATIKPVRAKLLTIPLRAAMTRAGKSRGDARRVGARYDRTYWRTSKKGNPILWGVRGKKRVPLFVGKTSVRIRGRHVFREEAAAIGATYVRNMTNELAKVLR